MSNKSNRCSITSEQRRIEAVLPEFYRLRDEHNATLFVYWQMSYAREEGTLYFGSFSRNKLRGLKGDGEKALKQVCALADKHKAPIILWCSSPELFEFYGRNGFKKTVHRGGSYSWQWFARWPKRIRHEQVNQE